jgi:hypothetical protein
VVAVKIFLFMEISAKDVIEMAAKIFWDTEMFQVT